MNLFNSSALSFICLKILVFTEFLLSQQGKIISREELDKILSKEKTQELEVNLLVLN